MSNKVTLVLMIGIVYDPNGTPTQELKDRLNFACVQHPFGEGLLTGDSDAEIDEYNSKVIEVPHGPDSDDTLLLERCLESLQKATDETKDIH